MATDVAELVKHARRAVSEMQEKTFEACSTNVDAASITNQLQLLTKSKQDVKDKFHKTLTINSFMQNLTKPREQWDAIVTQNDEELQTARSTLKEAQHKIDDKKTNIMQLNAVTAEALALYKQNMKSLETRVQCLEKMCEELETLQESLNSFGDEDESLTKEVQAQLAQCNEESHACRKELLRLQHKKAQVELRVSHLEEDLQQLHLTLDEDQERMDTQCLLRLEKSISSMEAWSGVTCKVPNSNTIVVSFPPSQFASTSPSFNAKDDLTLQVTLTFQENSLGSLRLSKVQSNMASFDLADLWGGEGEDSVDSVPSLIHTIKQRWLSHVPLLSEVNQLRSKFAIDWIQQESTLRVIVGKGGGIVCSLHIPSGYPHQGQVTLTNVMGASDTFVVEDLKPSTGRRLEDWVCFLEDLFGKP
ncbi:uncharacterized protein LOC143282366 [Babylonia areolata]|uniref:uncharacterized protein LOC143282366 n=1 Tax=Babylonia areolata TaxID=304850 RepID=UPI003FD3804E